MRCPVCWHNTKIYKTRHNEKLNKVLRYHKCLNRTCNNRFRTLETVHITTLPKKEDKV